MLVHLCDGSKGQKGGGSVWRYPWSYCLFLCTGAGWLSIYIKFPFDLSSLPPDDTFSLIGAWIALVFAVGGVALAPIVFMFEFVAVRNKD